MKKILTRVERLILMHQFQRIKEVGKSERYDAECCDNFIEILDEGYEYFYDKLLPTANTTFSLEKSEFVINILEFYREIHNLIKENGAKRLMERSDRIFPGFDGIKESRHYSFCWFAIEKMGRFSEQYERLKSLKHELSSPEPMIPKYQRMLAARHAIPSKKITEDQAIAILEA